MAQTRKQKILGDVKRARRQRNIITIIIIVVLAVSIAAVIAFLYPRTPPNPLIGAPISTTMYNQLTGVSNTTLQRVGSGQGVVLLTHESGQPLLLSGGKPEVLYIGADYCPYCAAERWSVIVALSKFGTFSGLTYMQSGDSPEAFPNTSTFSFGEATYSSSYNITFVSVEEQHRDRSSFQTPSQQDQNALNKFDASGSIPFVDIANQDVDVQGAQFPVGVLSGLNWTQIGSQLNTPNSPIAQAVDGAANTIIRAICNVDGGNPSSLCGLTLAPPTQAPLSATSTPPSSTSNPIATSVTPSVALTRKACPRPS